MEPLAAGLVCLALGVVVVLAGAVLTARALMRLPSALARLATLEARSEAIERKLGEAFDTAEKARRIASTRANKRAREAPAAPPLEGEAPPAPSSAPASLPLGLPPEYAPFAAHLRMAPAPSSANPRPARDDRPTVVEVEEEAA
jgi:hypothetical protein